MNSVRAGDGIVGQIELLFAQHGHVPYEGARREAVTALEHALQCAQLAEWANADASLVAAALLHDVGHGLAAEAVLKSERVDDRHEMLALPFLAEHFGVDVTEPVRLHVQAKRYLVRVDAGYAAQLSAASVHSLGLQGGAMDDAEVAAFEALPFAEQAVLLRRWDDGAKLPGRRTPPLDYYLALLDDLLQRPWSDSRTGIGALDIA